MVYDMLPPLLPCRNVDGNGYNNNEYTLAIICFTISVCLGGSCGGGNNNGDGDYASNVFEDSGSGSGGCNGNGCILEGLSAIVDVLSDAIFWVGREFWYFTPPPLHHA
jgi:hypothetical protein